jgi:serine/threonine-protein kinase
MIAPAAWPTPGATFDGKFQIVRLLGEGGMGAVFRAKHLRLGELVALKVVRPELIGREDLRARFLREARAAARLRTRHVARVLDVDVSDGGIPYLVLEHLEGGDLAHAIERAPLPPDVAARYVVDACEALAEAHALGVVHRDIKPQNLFLARAADGTTEVKVLDFGLAKHIDGARMTSSNDAMGTPLYMPPEQIKGARDVDARGDVWSLGVTLFEAVTGVLPFEAPNPAALLYAIAHSPARVPSSIRGDLSSAFDAVVARCLEKDADKRYANAIDFGAALAPLCGLDVEETRARLEKIADEARARVHRENAPEPVIVAPSMSEADTLQARTAPAVATTVAARNPRKIAGIVAAIAGVVIVVIAASGLAWKKLRGATSTAVPPASAVQIDTLATAALASTPTTPTMTATSAPATIASAAPSSSAPTTVDAGVSAIVNRDKHRTPRPRASAHVGASNMTGE